MAKKKSKSSSKDLETVLNEMIEDAENELRKTIKLAANKIQKDVYEKAKKDLQSYYDNYTPSMYDRQNKLRRAILPYYADRSNSKSITIEVGVQYNASALIGAYRSNSWYHQGGDKWYGRDSGIDFNSQNNGIPEPDWILDNYLEGIHPFTRIEKTPNGKREYIYTPIEDKDSPTKLMEQFIETELPDKINDYIYESFIERIIANQGGK